MLTKYVTGKDIHKYNFVKPGAIAICRYSGLPGRVLMKRQFIVDVGMDAVTHKEFQQVPYAKEKHYEQVAFETGLVPFFKEVWSAFKRHFLAPTNKISKKDLIVEIKPKKPDWEE